MAPLPCHFFRGVGRLPQCPSGMPEFDRGVAPSREMLLWQASTPQGGSRQAWRCPSGGPELTRGVAPSPAMPLWQASALQGGLCQAQRCPSSVPALDRGGGSGDAPLAGQCSTGGSCQARQCPSGGPVLNRRVAQSPAMPLWCASIEYRGGRKSSDAPLACQCSTGVKPSLAMPLGCASEQQRGYTKPCDAHLVGQFLKGGSRQARRCPSGRPALNRGLQQSRRCPSGGLALERGVVQSPLMPLWWDSTRQGGVRGMQAAAMMAGTGGDGVILQTLNRLAIEPWRIPLCGGWD